MVSRNAAPFAAAALVMIVLLGAWHLRSRSLRVQDAGRASEIAAAGHPETPNDVASSSGTGRGSIPKFEPDSRVHAAPDVKAQKAARVFNEFLRSTPGSAGGKFTITGPSRAAGAAALRARVEQLAAERAKLTPAEVQKIRRSTRRRSRHSRRARFQGGPSETRSPWAPPSECRRHRR